LFVIFAVVAIGAQNRGGRSVIGFPGTAQLENSEKDFLQISFTFFKQQSRGSRGSQATTKKPAVQVHYKCTVRTLDRARATDYYRGGGERETEPFRAFCRPRRCHKIYNCTMSLCSAIAGCWLWIKESTNNLAARAAAGESRSSIEHHHGTMNAPHLPNQIEDDEQNGVLVPIQAHLTLHLGQLFRGELSYYPTVSKIFS